MIADTTWSPLQIRVLLHHYYSHDPFGHPSDAADEAAAMWKHLGILDENLCPTEKGYFFIRMLLTVPVPAQILVDPRLHKQEDFYPR